MNLKKTLLAASMTFLLAGCATGTYVAEQAGADPYPTPVVETKRFLEREENRVAPPAGGLITVAVYGFADKTGQRKPDEKFAQFSSAVTQGPEAYLIKALQDVGNGKWFRVIERVGVDNLVKERQMIRQMREIYEGPNAKQLSPLMFAGIIIEGGIIGYDSNVTSGGAGARMLGVGPQIEYRSDMVTVNIRAVSVSSGEVLSSVTVTKNIVSYADKVSTLRFVDLGTRALEAEAGLAVNESVNRATQRAIEAAVVELIRDGAVKGHWSYAGAKKEK